MTDIVTQHQLDILVLYSKSFLHDTYSSEVIKALELVVMLAVNLFLILSMKLINDYDELLRIFSRTIIGLPDHILFDFP